ncbi:MAG: hypothetical protein ACO3JG_15620 [Luteolibacter sp.]
MKTPKQPASRRRQHAIVRRVFSLPLSDQTLAEFVEQQGKRHRKGVAGYLRDLVSIDREKWMDMEQLRELALSKLTDNERAALGYSPNSQAIASVGSRKKNRGLGGMDS